MTAQDLIRQATAINELHERPLPPNAIEIAAQCRELLVLMVDEIGPLYRIRLRLQRIPVLIDPIPDGCFWCHDDQPVWKGRPASVIEPRHGSKVTLVFHPGVDLSKHRIRLLVDGVPYEVNGAAPETMERVKELPGPARMLEQGRNGD